MKSGLNGITPCKGVLVTSCMGELVTPCMGEVVTASVVFYSLPTTC